MSKLAQLAGRLGNFLEDRAGLKSGARRLLDRPITGGARWAYVFGSGAAFVLLLQAITGLLLATVYSASVTDAWASVHYIQHELTLGWLVRGLHHYGASAMVVAVLLHLGQALLFGAYKAPRELTWLSGAFLLFVILGFALTGYLLPWDQKGYWATQVATSIAGTLPLIGETAKTIAQGGSGYGNLTLTRFYAIHVLLLPALAISLVAAHIALFRRHGETPPPGLDEAQLEQSQPYWPHQALRDLVYALLLFLAVLACFFVFGPAPLQAPADPASDYVARPEWYFLSLFQLLEFLEGPLIVIGTLVIPGLGTVALLSLPFIDRAKGRGYGERKLVLAGAGATLAGIVALSAMALVADAKDEKLQKQQARSAEEATLAVQLASKYGVPPEGALKLWEVDPIVHGGRLFEEKCLTCHSLSGRGGQDCADLTGYGSPAWIAALVRNPDDPRIYGRGKYENEMPANPDLEQADVEALAHYISSLAGESAAVVHDEARAARGAELFEDYTGDCYSCHAVDPGEDANEGPHLGGYAGKAWLVGVISNAGHERFFGESNVMPIFQEELSVTEIEHLADYVMTLRELEGPLEAPKAKQK